MWLLVADSRGINVWCAAGGGHLTQHDVISALRTSGVQERVDHRDLVLPQLAATGVERRAVEAATGWRLRWGPAAAEDLPAYLDRGLRVLRAERSVRFPLGDRLQMALMWAGPLVPLFALVLVWLAGPVVALVGASAVASIVFGLFAGLPWLPLRATRGLPVYAGAALLGSGLGAGALGLLGLASPGALGAVAGACALGAALLSIDLPGSTPWMGSSINPSDFELELVPERCTGAADCVLVCPRDVLVMDGHAHKVRLAQADRCIRCGACVVQCPEDALRFRFDGGGVVEPATIRSTRMNLLGRRVGVDGGGGAAGGSRLAS